MITLFLASAVKPLITLDLPFPIWRSAVFSSLRSPITIWEGYVGSTTWVPGKANVWEGPKSAESARRIHCLIEIAKGLGRQLTVVVFEGECVSPSCLLSELHSRMALSWFALYMPDEARIGIKNWMYCCPICVYVINNCTTPPRSHRSWPLLGQLLLWCVSSFHYTHHSGNDGTSNWLWKVWDRGS